MVSPFVGESPLEATAKKHMEGFSNSPWIIHRYPWSIHEYKKSHRKFIGQMIGEFSAIVGYFCGKYAYIIGLKAPGNYLDQFWSNKVLVLLCEEPKPTSFVLSGCLDHWEPLFMDSNMPDYFQNIRKDGKVLKQFHKYRILENQTNRV